MWERNPWWWFESGKHLLLFLFRLWFGQCNKHLFAPTVYREQVCPVLGQGTMKIRPGIYFKTCPPVRPKNGVLSYRGSGQVVHVQTLLTWLSCWKEFKAWQWLPPPLENVCCRCIIIPATDRALRSFMEDSWTSWRHLTMPEAAVSVSSVYSLWKL